MPRAPYVPWTKIALLALLSLPPVLITFPLMQPTAVGAIGFATGFLASLYGRRLWACAAVAIAVTTGCLSLVLTGMSATIGLYAIALGLALAGFTAASRGGLPALAFAAFGWVFFAFSAVNDPVDTFLFAGIFAISGIWGAFSTVWLGVESMLAPKPEDRVRPKPGIALLTTLGFLITLALADHLPLERPYWVPFVFLQVIATTGPSQAHSVLRRMVGACLGSLVVFVLSLLGLPAWAELTLAISGFALALRVVAAYPIISRTLTTASVILMLLPTDPGTLSARLLAELAAAFTLIVIAALAALLSPQKNSSGRMHDN